MKKLLILELNYLLMRAKLIIMSRLRASSNILINLFYQFRLDLSMEDK